MIMFKKALAGTLAGLVLCLLAGQPGMAQGTNKKETPKGWHLMDKDKDGYYGISLQKAYELMKGKKSTTIIVAVIDSGVDTLHEDLKDVLWHNSKEIPGNGIDDDGNGYVDDVYGWNFLGGKDGKNVTQDSYEGARVYHKYKEKYDGKQIDTTTMTDDQKQEYALWLRAKKRIEGDVVAGGIDLLLLKKALIASRKNDSVLRVALGKEVYTGKELETFTP